MLRGLEEKEVDVAILVGHSGAGKTRIGRVLRNKGYQEITSCTSRSIRDGELNGLDYYFMDDIKDFDTLDLVEHEVYDGQAYGILSKELDLKFSLSNKIFVVMEVQGALHLKSLLKDFKNINVKLFFITADIEFNEEVIRQRLKGRGDSDARIESRVRVSREKYARDLKECDYVTINSNGRDVLDCALEINRCLVGLNNQK